MKIKSILISLLLLGGMAFGQGQFNGGGGAGTIGGSGTTGDLPIFTAGKKLGNSNESEAGGLFLIGTSGGWKTTAAGPSIWSGTISAGLTTTVPGWADFSTFEGSDAFFHCETSSTANCLDFSAIGGSVDLTSQVTNVLPNANGGMTPPVTNGDVPCATTSGTVWGLLSGNTSGTKLLQESSSGVCSWVSGLSVTSISSSGAIATATLVATTSVGAVAFNTLINCASSTSPASCNAEPAGFVALPTGTNPTLVVDTTAVTANSQILLAIDSSLGSALGVTCNTTGSTSLTPRVTARSNGVSFTFTITAVIATNPVCISYWIIN